MSTTLDRRKARKNYAEFDEYISYQLQKTQTGIRSTDIFTALCGAAVFVVSYLLVFVVFDHWVVAGGFGPTMRVVLLSGLLAGTLAWLGWKVVWPFFRRVNSLYAAKALEQASPELKSTLINYVDLRSAARQISPAILGSMEKRAAVTLSHTEVDDAIDRSTLLKLSYALLVAVVLFSVYAVASPKKVWPSIVRIFAPGSEVSVSTQTTFLKVDPGDTTILAREFLTVSADLSGEVPPEVTLLYTTADGQFVDEPMAMREVEAGLKRYRCILKGVGGEGLLQGLSYRIVAGDAFTRTYHVTVSQPPSATVTSLRYSFPDYMELPPEQPSGSSIDTWEGTQIEIGARVNMPVERAWLQLSDEAEFPARCEEYKLEVAVDGTSVTGFWRPIIREDGTYPRFYRIQCRTKDGVTDPAPAVHSIRLQADQKPDVATLQPNRDMEVAANAIVPLLIQASDPDFRLSRVELRMRNGNRSLTDRPLYKGNDRQKQVRYDLKVAELNARPGDVITWWVEAHDNRIVETSDRILLNANRNATPRLTFTVRDPISEEDVNRQLEQDRKRAEEKLDELNQQPGKGDQVSDEPEPASPDQQSDAKSDMPTESSVSDLEKNESEPADPPADQQNSDGDAGGSDGQSGSDSNSKSNGQNEKNGDGQSGKSDGDQSGTGKKESGKGESGTESKPDSPNTQSGPRKPVSNDGSQDDEILRELLNRNRDPKSDSNQNSDDGEAEDKGSDGGKGDDGKHDQPSQNDQTGGKSESPKDGDHASDSPRENPGQPNSNPDGDDPDSELRPSPGTETSPKSSSDGQKPSDPSQESSEKQPDKNPAGDMPSESSGDPSKGDSGKGSSGKPQESAAKPKPDDSTEPQPNNSAEKTSGEDGSDAAQNDGGSGKQSSDGSSAKPESGMPNSDGGSDAGSEPSDNPSGKNSDTGEPSKSGSSEKGEGGSNSKSDPSGNNNQPGKPGAGDSDGTGANRSETAPPDGASPKQPSSENSGKGGAGSDSARQPPEKGASQSPPEGSGKPGADSASGKSDQSASGQPGDSPSGNESGTKPSQESSNSDADGNQKSGDDKGGQPGGKNSPDQSGGKSGGEKPSEGNPGGGKPQAGQSGSGQSSQPGGNPGQGTGGVRPNDGSDPGGDAAVRPDDNANPDAAVERRGSGANLHDSNLPDADQANLEDKLKASNMVLKRLKEELDRGEVDPELLKKLGWTESDMQRFAERLERQLAEPRPDDPGAEARRRQFEEVLRSVDLESSGRQQKGDFSDQKSTNNFSERRLPAPRSHRKAYEDYLKRLSRQRQSAPAPPSAR